MVFWTFSALFKGSATTAWPIGSGSDGQENVTGFPIYEPEAKKCQKSIEACPTHAIEIKESKLKIDYGKCVNCQLCSDKCDSKEIRASTNYDVSTIRRGELLPLGFKRSLHIRHVDAGSCNGCESELDAMQNPFYDMQRLGFFFTPSPRFADLLLVTGPVTYNMKGPLLEAYAAMPEPRFVMACGTCAVSGGTNGGGYACYNGLEGILPIDIYLPGCPPNPAAIITALMTFLDRRIES